MITAIPLSPQNQCEPEGIPYYLPKPLLVIAKNTRHIDESKVGLTNPVPIPNGFDNQAAYADVKANVTVPGSGDGAASKQAADTGDTNLAEKFDENTPGLPPQMWESMIPEGRLRDGVAPDSFFTYQIIFVPDLSQKYGLRIKGGPGELRAAMNLVNGWMYTGMGPFYLKDSSTAQNRMAVGVGAMFAGRGAANVLNEASNFARVSQPTATAGTQERAAGGGSDFIDGVSRLARFAQTQAKVPQTILNYAEIYIYEPVLNSDGSTQWRLVASHNFDRQFFCPELDNQGVKLLESIMGMEAPEGDEVPAELEGMEEISPPAPVVDSEGNVILEGSTGTEAAPLPAPKQPDANAHQPNEDG